MEQSGTPGLLAGVLSLIGWVELMFFLGQYHHTIDDKGRLTIPARYRDVLAANGACVMQGFDHNLMVWTASAYDHISQRVNRLSITDPSARMLKRLIFSTADRVEVDKAGRILIPQFLREFAELESEAVLIGNGDYFEIWSPAVWSSQELQLQDAEGNQQRFQSLALTME